MTKDVSKDKGSSTKIVIIIALLLIVAICVGVFVAYLMTKEDPEEGDGALTYEEYLAMTAEERLAYYYTYEDPEDFYVWYNAAKKKYEEEQNREVIDGENPEINLGGE